MLIIVCVIGVRARKVQSLITTNLYRSGAQILRRFIALFILMFMIASSSASNESGPETSTQSYKYQLWDVFTDKALAGNQLAVFTSAQGLSAELMQKIAREMAFSETSFVFRANEDEVDARVRIFSPTRELAFAGHPTIGTAFALAASGAVSPGTKKIVFTEGIGPVLVQLEWQKDNLRFAWMHQRRPVFGKTIEDLSGIAQGLGVPQFQVTSLSLPVQEVSCGSPYIMVPVASRSAVDQARVNSTVLGSIFDKAGVTRRSMLVFAMEPAGSNFTVYSRMLRFDGTEDPATGGASGPLGSYLVNYGLVTVEKASSIISSQGVQMGRPSQVYVRIRSAGKEITEVQVGGSAVHVGEGSLFLPDAI
jgi:trans-2,3-dihydro-3-hydroxyanthranilate isomerase